MGTGFYREYASAPTADTAKQRLFKSSRSFTPHSINIFGHKLSIDLATGNLVVTTNDVKYGYYKLPFGITRAVDVQRQHMHDTYMKCYPNVDPKPSWFGNWKFNHEVDVDEVWKQSSYQVQITSGNLNCLLSEYDTKYKRSPRSGSYVTNLLRSNGIPQQSIKDIGYSASSQDFILRTVRGAILFAAGRHFKETVNDLSDTEICVFNPLNGFSYSISSKYHYSLGKDSYRDIGHATLLTKVSDNLGHSISLKPIEDNGPYRKFILSDGSTLPNGRKRNFEIEMNHSWEFLDGLKRSRKARKYLVNRVTDQSKDAYNQFEYQYDKKHRLVKVIYPSSIGSRWITYKYNDDNYGELETIENSKGGRISFKYDLDILDCDERLNPRLKIQEIIGPENERIKYKYDTSNKRVVAKVYDGDVLVTETSYSYLFDHENTKRRYIYEERTPVKTGYRLTSSRNISDIEPGSPQEVIIRTEYSSDGRYNVLRKYDGLGRYIRYEYNDFNQLSKLYNFDGKWIKYIYDIKDDSSPTNPSSYDLIRKETQVLVRTKDTSNSIGYIDHPEEIKVEEFKYNKYSNSTSNFVADIDIYSTHRLNKSVLKRLDVLQNGLVEYLYSYDDLNNYNSIRPTRVTTPEGIRSFFKFNERGEMVEVMNNQGHRYRKQYNAQGNVTKVIDQNSFETSFRYYPCGNWLQTFFDEDNKTVDFKRDENGLIYEVIDQVDDQIKYKYLKNNRVASIHKERKPYLIDSGDPSLGSRIRPYTEVAINLKYNPFGKITEIVGPNSLKTINEFDELGRRVCWYQDQNRNEKTKYVYNKANQLLCVENKGREKTFLQYNALGYISKIEYPNWSDDLGNLENGKIIEFDKYDYQGRILNFKNSEFLDSVYCIYDLSGNKIFRHDQSGNEVDFIFDLDDRLIQVKEANINYLVRYEYDTLSKLSKVKDQGVFDGENEWIYHYTKSNPSENTIVGNLYSIVNTSTNLEFKFDYDEKSRLISTINRVIDPAISNPVNTLFNSQIEYRADNLIEKKTGNDPNFYLYDSIKQIILEGANDMSFDYDISGNRLYSVDKRITPNPSDNQYDNLGRLDKESELNYNFKYNVKGQLVEEQISGNPNSKINYYYDGQGKLRIVKSLNERITYKYDEAGRLMNRSVENISGGNVNHYAFKYLLNKPFQVLKDGSLDQVLTWDTNGRLLRLQYQKSIDNSFSFPHSLYPSINELGNINRVYNSSNIQVISAIYDSWGNISKDGLIDRLKFFGFRSAIMDENTRLYLFGNRWYKPSIGRWISEDTITEMGGGNYNEITNLYRFVQNNPIAFDDPSGLKTEASNPQKITFSEDQVEPIVGNPNANLNTPESGLIAWEIGMEEYREWFHRSTFHNVFIPLFGIWLVTAAKGVVGGLSLSAGEAIIEFGLFRGGLLGVSSNATKSALSETMLRSSVKLFDLFGKKFATFLIEQATDAEKHQGDITESFDVIDLIPVQ